MNRRLLHIGIHESRNRNAGDTLLFPLVRDCIDQIGPIDWELRQLWDPFRHDEAANARRFDGIVIGGGGLLLRDQAGAEASVSGWQWNATLDAVRSLKVPLVVFAIGYNRFRGQPDFDPPFAKHLTATVESSAFFGLRNSGSIQAVRRYLPDELQERISLQPCPTTLLWMLDESRAAAIRARATPRRPVLALNIAFDRSEMRFGERPEAAFEEIARSIARAESRGWEIRYVAHKTMDLGFVAYLSRAGVDVGVVDVTALGRDAVVDAYADCDLAVGARGHAQMIPFGLRRPIISLITHDKLAWFLEDIGHPEWGIEVAGGAFEERFDAAIERVETDPLRIRAELEIAQHALWDRTNANLSSIAARLPIQHET